MPLESLTLRSGLKVEAPQRRLLAFMREEYDYYDAVRDDSPNEITLTDVLVTLMVNSFLQGAAKLRKVHRGLKTCETELTAVAPHADLMAVDWPRGELKALLQAAIRVNGVLIPVATKVLHRKRPALIPMLDSVINRYYLEAFPSLGRLSQFEDKKRAVSAAMAVIEVFREDILASIDALRAIQSELSTNGYRLTLVRILEVLIWIEREPIRVYRSLT